jgi:hypothetical protein
MYRILPKISPPFSAVDMSQTGEGAYIRICATHLEYKPPPADGFSHRMDSTLVLSSNTAARTQHSSKKQHYARAIDSTILARPTTWLLPLSEEFLLCFRHDIQ